MDWIDKDVKVNIITGLQCLNNMRIRARSKSRYAITTSGGIVTTRTYQQQKDKANYTKGSLRKTFVILKI